jgi:hypothetical protein
VGSGARGERAQPPDLADQRVDDVHVAVRRIPHRLDVADDALDGRGVRSAELGVKLTQVPQT